MQIQIKDTFSCGQQCQCNKDRQIQQIQIQQVQIKQVQIQIY